jgi:hypothetical protein
MERVAFITRLEPTKAEALRTAASLHHRPLTDELAAAVEMWLAATAQEPKTSSAPRERGAAIDRREAAEHEPAR